MTRKRQRPEDTIQKAVFEHLRTRGKRGVFAFHCPNGGLRSRTEAAILKGLGVVSGIPDMIAIYQGRVYTLELKAPNGRISDAQIACRPKLEAAGAICGIAWDLDLALAILESWGLLRGRAAIKRGVADLPAENFA